MVDGNRLVSKLKKLSETNAIKDVGHLTNYLFPGSHCPLMGATMAIRGIKEALMVVVGTDECTYYNKSSLGSSTEFGGITGRCVSIVLNDYDVTFGSIKKTEESFKEIMEEYNPSCIFLVTTCVIEIIGDDMDSLANALSETYGVPIMSVHTEHFKSLDHLPGLERTMAACLQLMETQEVCKCVNIIGERLGDITKSELFCVLKECDMEIGMIMPGNCDIADIKIASKAKVNIVVHSIGLALAQAMEKKFGTPFVFFDRVIDPERIHKRYKDLFELLEEDIPQSVTEKYMQGKNTVDKLRPVLKNLSYIYANTPLQNLEFNEFLCRLGMEPLLIQLSKVDKQDLLYKAEILKTHNPYVTKSANLVPFQHACDTLKPMLYIGSRDAVELSKKGITTVSSNLANSMLGFEVTEYLMQQMQVAIDNAVTNKGELRKKKDIG